MRSGTSRRASSVCFGAISALVLFGASVTHAGATPPATVLLLDNRASIDQIDNVGTLYPPYEPDTQIEPSIAVNPANPLNAVASTQQGRADHGASSGTGWATTFDGGQTWSTGNVPQLTKNDVQPCGGLASCAGPWDRASDPVVAFGPNNTVYQSSLLINGDPDTTGTTDAGLSVNISKDGGATWKAPVVMHSSTTITGQTGFFDDKNWIVVDNSSAPGHHLGRVYVVWDIFNVNLYAYCDSDSLVTGDCSNQASWTTFSGPTNNQGFYSEYPGRGIGAIPLVLNTGGLEVVLDDFQLNEFVEVTAVTAGAVQWPAALNFAAPVVIAAPTAAGVPEQRAGPTLPTAAVDNSSGVSGTVYVGWSDTRFRSDGKNDAVFAASDPNTGQFAQAVVKRINNGSTSNGIDSYNTMLAVGPDGSLRAGYRQRDESGSTPYTTPIDTYYQVSYDQGTTFSTPLKVDTQSTNDGYCAFSRGGCFLGDYNELAAAGANTYIVRAEAYASYANEPYNNVAGNFAGCPVDATGPNGFRCHTHQRAWVAVVGPPPTGIAESPLVPALTLVGVAGGVTALIAARRRRAAQRRS